MFNKIFVICPSEAVNHFYQKVLPIENIFNEYSDEWIEKINETINKIKCR